MGDRQESLIVVGSGKAAFREYALAAMAAKSRIVLIDFQEPTWARQYIHAFHLIEPPVSRDRMGEIMRQVAHQERATGIITYDERYVVEVARLADELGLPGGGLQAVVACRDKWETRKRLAEAELGGVKVQLVRSQDEAVAAAAKIGLPVVLKPRSLSGSIGVMRVDRLEDVPDAFEIAAKGSYPNLMFSVPGVLVEEFIEGEEFSIDSVVHNGQVHPLFVATKFVGLAPYFEELGHVVASDGLELLPGIHDFLQKVHQVIGFRNGVTHTELRVTQKGYKIMEVNARLGGDLIPYLGFLATGIDLAGALADVAQGRKPHLCRTRSGAAAIRFIYPERDMILQSVNIPEVDFGGTGTYETRILVSPGTQLWMPPKGYMSRIAMVLAQSDNAKNCLHIVKSVSDKTTLLDTANC